MDHAQAEATVGLLQAYFPRPELPDSTVQLWALELEGFDFEDAREGVRWLAHNRSYPVLADLLDAAWDARRARMQLASPELPGRAWTEEDEATSMAIGAEVLRGWREARTQVAGS